MKSGQTAEIVKIEKREEKEGTGEGGKEEISDSGETQ